MSVSLSERQVDGQTESDFHCGGQLTTRHAYVFTATSRPAPDNCLTRSSIFVE